MLSIPRNRLIPLVAAILIAISFPLAAFHFQNFSFPGYFLFSLIFKSIFPFQIFPIIFFLVNLLFLNSFWWPLFLYLIIVIPIFVKISRLNSNFLSKRRIFIFGMLCVIFYFVNEIIFLFQVSDIFHPLPEQPVVQ
jgi:hypothetical protein